VGSSANITIITVVVGVPGKPMITCTLRTVPDESGRRGTDADITSSVPIVDIRGLGLTRI